MKIFLWISIFLSSLASCKTSLDFQAGQCIQAKDHYIYKISRIEGSEYIVQGWLPGWGNETSLSESMLALKHGHSIVSCPSI